MSLNLDADLLLLLLLLTLESKDVAHQDSPFKVARTWTSMNSCRSQQEQEEAGEDEQEPEVGQLYVADWVTERRLHFRFTFSSQLYARLSPEGWCGCVTTRVEDRKGERESEPVSQSVRASARAPGDLSSRLLILFSLCT